MMFKVLLELLVVIYVSLSVNGMSIGQLMEESDDRSSLLEDSLVSKTGPTLLESALKDLNLVSSGEETMNDNPTFGKQTDLTGLDLDDITTGTVTAPPTTAARFNYESSRDEDGQELPLTFTTSQPQLPAIVNGYQPVKADLAQAWVKGNRKKYLLMNSGDNAIRKKLLNKNHPRRMNKNNVNGNGNIKKIFKLDRSLQRLEKKSWNAPVQSISAYLEILNHSQSSQNKVSGIRNLLSSFNNS